MRSQRTAVAYAVGVLFSGSQVALHGDGLRYGDQTWDEMLAGYLTYTMKPHLQHQASKATITDAVRTM